MNSEFYKTLQFDSSVKNYTESKKEFIEINKVTLMDLHNVKADDLYEKYTVFIKPHLVTINDYVINENDGKMLSMDELSLSLGVTKKVISLCVKFFKELDDARKGKYGNVVGLRARIRLDKAIELKPTQPKLIEMDMLRNDKGYKPKGEETSNDIPPKIIVEFKDETVTEEALEEKFQFDFNKKEEEK